MINSLTQKFKNEAQTLGFDQVGIVKAEPLQQEAKKLEDWLNKHAHASMSYMERYFDLRIDPTQLMPGAQSVIMLSYNYFQEHQKKSEEHPNISMYAYGKDYHKVIKKKLHHLISWLQHNLGDIQARAFVDSAPIMERDWAKRAGIAWSGKNTLSIHPKRGSYFFLACILTDVKFEYDHPIKDYCGRCKKCIEACPTDALHPEGYFLDASKCISYLTIEHKNSIDDQFKPKMNKWIYGCDICQQVCPWNRFSTKHNEPDFEPVPELLEKKISDWAEISEENFNTLFSESAIQRTTAEGMKRNANFIRQV